MAVKKNLWNNTCNNHGNLLGIIHLARTQDFPKNEHFLPPD